ncbi:MAG: YihY/virulence factor BrkB family protein [Chloroflexi bacterium]|nr:YihY/virulence factor BrkB family protein [Chloroflexota bacterium]
MLATLFRRSAKGFLDDNCTQTAAAISYYVLFSLFPLLIFLVGVMGLFLRDEGLQTDVIDAVLDFIPLSEGEGRNRVTDAVQAVAGPGSSALGALGLIGMAWAGSNMFGVIRRAINTAYGVEQRRPWAQQKLLDLAMALGVSVFFLLSVGATAFLRAVREFSGDIAYLGDAAEWAGFLWDAASVLVPLLLSFVAFLVLYWTVPAGRTRLGEVWPGALVAAVLFEVAKVGFAIYVQNFGNYDIVFGSLGAVASFLFGIYVSANVMLFGAEVASQHQRIVRGEHVEAGPAPPLGQTIRRAVRGLFVHDREGDGAPRRQP